MPTLHRTMEKAAEEARELLVRYNQRSIPIVRSERIYDDFQSPGYEALTFKELTKLRSYSKPIVVAIVNKYRMNMSYEESKENP